MASSLPLPSAQEQEPEEQAQAQPPDYYNLDPSVVALLQPLPENATESQLHGRIALCKLQQATVVGHAKLAATWLDTALREASRDKRAHELLQHQMQALQERLRRLDTKDNTQGTTTTTLPGVTVAATPLSAVSSKDNEDGNDAIIAATDSAQVQQLQSALEAAQTQVASLQDVLYQHVSADLANLQLEQQALQAQQARFQSRFKACETIVQQQFSEEDSPRREELTTALSEIAKRQYQQSSSSVNNAHGGAGPCVVCHDAPAALAVIPCGHVCLCEACVETVVTTDDVAKQCPVCRGLLLSTLKIYSSASS